MISPKMISAHPPTRTASYTDVDQPGTRNHALQCLEPTRNDNPAVNARLDMGGDTTQYQQEGEERCDPYFHSDRAIS
jgi:hypothetical protein